jgi:hypothetical protein
MQSAAVADEVAEPAVSVHWTLWTAVVAVTSAIVGAHWDIAWHRSIGRDTFWIAPHLLIQACGILGGVIACVRIFGATLAKRRHDTVRVWGFSGPLGAFVCAWGAVAMISSAPFDDWWHNTYGLDVRILSPPHTLLGLGIGAVGLGSLLLILGAMNNASGAERRKLLWMYSYVAGLGLVMVSTFLMERTDRTEMHSGFFYRDICIAIPLMFLGPARGANDRWAATRIAAIFSIFLMLCLWILPLMPASPKLGPVFYPVTHLVPAPFPLLLIAPAIAVDLISRRKIGGWLAGGLLGTTFLVVYLAAQWPFGTFLVKSEMARNWFWGAAYFDYGTPPWSNTFQNLFDRSETRGELWRNLGLAWLFAIIGARLAVAWGDWMRRVRR